MGAVEAPERTVPGRGPLAACGHCGAPLIDARMRETGFCCAGCAFVRRLVLEHGLEGYYRLKDPVTAPADTAVFQPRDYLWLESAQREAEASGRGGPPEMTVDLQGISCAGCVWLIERLFHQQPGARSVAVNAQLGSLRMGWFPGAFSAADFARKLQSFGYLVGPPDPRRADSESGGLIGRIGLCAAFALNVMLFTLPAYFGMQKTAPEAGLFRLLALVFATLSFLVGGTYFLDRAWRAARAGALHIDLPIAIGILGAYLGSLYGWLNGRERFVYFDFVATFILLMLVGRWAQTAAVERNRRRLLSRQPDLPSVESSDGRGLSLEQIRPGVRFLVRSGGTVPVEARLPPGRQGLFSFSSINGEAEPRLLQAGQRIMAGSVNVARGKAELDALETWSESLLARLLQPGARPGWRHAIMERVVRGYLVGILATALGAGIAWWFATSDGAKTWSVVTAVLVVSCPCAIGLAFPFADELATTALRRRGVFVRDGDLWAKLGRVRKVIFDKTGTLTLETPMLCNPGEIASLDGAARAALLALVQGSAHPVSQCLLENLLSAGPTEPLPGEVRETLGFGVELGPWSLGRAGWRGPRPEGSFAEGATELCVDGRVVARFRFSDAVRPDARAEVGALCRAGFEVHILSGDDRSKVKSLAEALGLPADRALGALAPGEKADWLANNGCDRALMLGDGANDSLAFDRALCRGTPVIHRGLLERKSDFFYLGRGVGGIRELFRVHSILLRTHAAVLVFSITYNLLAVGLAVAGGMSPLLAAVLMPASSLLTLALVAGGMRPAFRSSECSPPP